VGRSSATGAPVCKPEAPAYSQRLELVQLGVEERHRSFPVEVEERRTAVALRREDIPAVPRKQHKLAYIQATCALLCSERTYPPGAC
jgi:hypothetical protein